MTQRVHAISEEVWSEYLHHGYWRHPEEDRREAARNLVLKAAEKCGVRPGDRVCDVGCGYGAAARLLYREYGARVIGVTASDDEYIQAGVFNRDPEGPLVLLQGWLDNGFSDEIFDHVLSLESSTLAWDKERFFYECHRVLKPGGRLLLTTWLTGSEIDPGAGGWRRSELLTSICRDSGVPELWPRVRLIRCLERVGFSEIEFEDVSDSVKRTWTECISGALAYLAQDESSRSMESLRTLFRIRMAYTARLLRYGMISAVRC